MGVLCPVCTRVDIGVSKQHGKCVVMCADDAPLHPNTGAPSHQWRIRVCPLCDGIGKVPEALAAAYLLKTGSGEFDDALTYRQIRVFRRSFKTSRKRVK